MWRQGDILIDKADALPEQTIRLKGMVLARGDSTGQRHRIKEQGAAEIHLPQRVRLNDVEELFLVVSASEATVVHPEHGPITLPRGTYRVWKQREFSEVKPRPVVD